MLRLPPYHPELNPIEIIWGIMKNWVATKNITFKLQDVKKLVTEKCADIGKEEWKGVCKKVKEIENNCITYEIGKEERENEVIINLELSDSSDFSDDSDDVRNIVLNIVGLDCTE